MKYVTCMGELYCLSEAAYRKFLKAVSEGKCPDPEPFGKYLGYVKNITDLTIEEAKEELRKYK